MTYTPRPPSDEEIEAAFAGLEKSYDLDRFKLPPRCPLCGQAFDDGEDLADEAHREGPA